MQNRIEELAQNCFEYYEGTLDGDDIFLKTWYEGIDLLSKAAK